MMKLEYTAEERAFRAEVRAWMESHVPKNRLPSFDLTREGFEAHREWERTRLITVAGAWSPGLKPMVVAASISCAG